MHTRRDDAQQETSSAGAGRTTARILERLVTREPERNADRLPPESSELEQQRQFVDHCGQVWRVREHRIDDDPQPSLVFESEIGWRRVRRYPTEWRAMSRDELERLSQER